MGFTEKFEAGVFTVLAELDPPKGADAKGIIEIAVRSSSLIDAYVIPEMGSAIMRMSPLGIAPLLANHGIEGAIEIVPWHQNRLAIQGTLLAAHALGAAAIVVSEGTSPEYGDHNNGKAVEDLSYAELVKITCDIKNGIDLAGNEIDGSPDYFVGALLSDPSENKIEEAARFGVDFVVSPPVFDEDDVTDLLDLCRKHGMALIVKIVLLKSVGMARYLQQHIAGVSIPDSIVDRVRQAKNTADECVACAADLLNGVRNVGASGALVCTYGWENRLFDLMSRAAL